MWYLLKNSQAVKKVCKMASIKKLWNTVSCQEMAVMVSQLLSFMAWLFWVDYPKKCLCVLFYVILGYANFCTIVRKNDRNFEELKFYFMTPRNEINHQNMLAEQWSGNCHFWLCYIYMCKLIGQTVVKGVASIKVSKKVVMVAKKWQSIVMLPITMMDLISPLLMLICPKTCLVAVTMHALRSCLCVLLISPLKYFGSGCVWLNSARFTNCQWLLRLQRHFTVFFAWNSKLYT